MNPKQKRNRYAAFYLLLLVILLCAIYMLAVPHDKAEELTFSGGLWLFPLSQGESFALRPGPVRAQVRVAWANGVVEGCVLPGVYVDESISGEVL